MLAPSVPSPATLQVLALGLAVVVSLAVVYRLEGPGGAWGARLRRRFVLGVPWGTLTVVAVVLGVYLFVQGGFDHWYDPTVIPFRAWSYLYPLGMVSAAFAHSGPGHLTGNLIGTVTLAPLVEYAWGHFPRERGASSFGDPWTNPLVRAFVLFPAGALAFGLFTAVFTLGPVIGFSGVVFAFAGFALTRYPLGTVLALVSGRVLDLLKDALRSPLREASGRPVFVTPWWADIAIQGHAVGLLGGVLVGAWFARRRELARPSGFRLFAGTLLFAVSQALWAVYWFRGGNTFVLYRAVGAALVFALATLVAAAFAASEGPLWARLAAGADSGADRFVDAVRTASGRQVAFVVLVLAAATLAGPAVPVNLMTTAGGDLPGEELEVRDYEVTYAEGVENGMVAVVNVSAFGETTSVETSGVIVRSRARHLWTTAVPKARLAFAGTVRVRVGGLGWRDSVVVERSGWTALAGGTAYRVTLTDDGRSRTVFTSPPARAGPVLAGRNLSVAAGNRTFFLVVSRNNSSSRAAIPGPNETVRLEGIRFVRRNETVVARYEGTVITVFQKERYRGQED